LKTRNLLIFRDAKNAKNGKIAPNWNVSGTRDFSFAEQNSRLLRFICFRVAYHLEISSEAESHVQEYQTAFQF
jgi:hypothetical protein